MSVTFWKGFAIGLALSSGLDALLIWAVWRMFFSA